MLIAAHASDEYVACMSVRTDIPKADAKKYLSYYNQVMRLNKKDNCILGMKVVPIKDVTFYSDLEGKEEIEDVQDVHAEISKYSLQFRGISKYPDVVYYSRTIGWDEIKDIKSSGKELNFD